MADEATLKQILVEEMSRFPAQIGVTDLISNQAALAAMARAFEYGCKDCKVEMHNGYVRVRLESLCC